MATHRMCIHIPSWYRLYPEHQSAQGNLLTSENSLDALSRIWMWRIKQFRYNAEKLGYHLDEYKNVMYAMRPRKT